MHLDLIATGGRDKKVRIWDYERIQSQDENPDFGPMCAHSDEVSMVKFIAPFPLLITTDLSGQLYIWLTKPHKKAGTCILSWRNTFTLNKNCPITAIDTYYSKEEDKFLMILGDEMGQVRIQDISYILKQTEIPDIYPVDTSNVKRNPYREIEIKDRPAERNHFEDMYDEERIKQRNAIVKESKIVQIGQLSMPGQTSAHSDAIRSLQYIPVTDEPLIFTASADKFVKIWNMKGEHLGTLKQGYMMLADYEWRFPCAQFDSKDQKQVRRNRLHDFINKDREDPERLKRLDKIQRLKSEQQSYKNHYMSQTFQTQQPATAFGLHKQAAQQSMTFQSSYMSQTNQSQLVNRHSKSMQRSVLLEQGRQVIMSQQF